MSAAGFRAGPGITRAALRPRRCHVCGCTETNACPGGCWWIGADLCSSCGPRAARHLKHREPKRITRSFWFRRYAGFDRDVVIWTLSWRVGERVYKVDQAFDINDIQQFGRDKAARTLRILRAQLRSQA